MAVTGTLADMALIDLIQFPHAGSKTGELRITSGEEIAKLFYERGRLVHVETGDLTGMEALVRIISLEEGEFSYEAESETEQVTITIDLHQAVMEALKLHDERKHEEERQNAGVDEETIETDERFLTRIGEFVKKSEAAHYACIVSPKGRIQAEAHAGPGAPEHAGKLREVIYTMLASYPRDDLSQVIVVDGANTVVAQTLQGGSGLIVIADRAAPRGSVAMNVDRLANDLV